MQKKSIVYLDRKVFQEKYDAGYARLISEKYQEALGIFLELRELRFNDFELLQSVSECYFNLGQIDKLKEMISIMKIKYDNTKAEEIQKIEKQLKLFKVNEIKLQNNIQNYNILSQLEINTLTQDGLCIYCIYIIYSGWTCYNLGNFKLLLDIQSKLSPQNQNYEQLIIYSNYLNHNYKTTQEIIGQTQNKTLLNLQNSITGLCYYKMKQYSQAQSYLYNKFDQKQDDLLLMCILDIHSSQLDYQFCNFLGNLKSSSSEVVLFFNIMYFQENFALNIKNVKQRQQEQLLNFFLIQINAGYPFDCHPMFMLYYNNHKDPIRQQQMIDLMLKYNPKLAEAYLDQYLLSKQEKLEVDLNYLINQLLQCHDSVCKFTSIALLQQDQGKFEEALMNLEAAKKLNPFDSDVLQQERGIHLSMKNYIKARKVEQQMVILEKENSHFVLSQVAPYIRQYQFHEALGLLNLIEGNEIIRAHKILLKLVNYQYLNQQDKQNIENKISYMSELYNKLYQGNISLIYKNNKFSRQNYCQVYASCERKLKMLQSVFIQWIHAFPLYQFVENLLKQIKPVISLSEDHVSQLSEIDSIELMLNISSYQYFQANESFKLRHQRFKQSFSSLFVTLLYNADQMFICQWINTNQSYTIPFMADLFTQIEDILQELYKVNLKTKEDYSKQLQREFNKLQSQFSSFQVCFQELSLFLESQEFENEIIEIIKSGVDKLFENQLTKVFENSYFYDPYSKLALNFLIKVFGYFIDFEDFTSGYYKNHTELWRYLLISRTPEQYFQGVIKLLWDKKQDI